MPAPSAISFRFFVAFGLLCMLAGSGFLLLIFGPTSYAQVQELGRHTYHEGGYRYLPLAVTPSSYQLLRYGLVAVALGSFGGLVALSSNHTTAFRREAQLFRQECYQAWVTLGSVWQQLPRLEKLIACGLLALILAVRVWYLINYVLGTDEVASYDYFVRPGLLTISCFYPIPNNHLLFNFTCWPLTFFTDNTRLVMRLPTFAASMAGTTFGYLLLLRWSNFRVATLATGLFSLLPLSLYYAVAGRGYFLQLTLLLLAFFAALAVLRSRTYQRLGWAVFIATSILGFYAIPTFLYPFVSLALGLLLGLGWQRRWAELRQLALASCIVGVVTALLYWPVICVSGLQQLIGNRYVATMSDTAFWPQYLKYLRILADMLAGNGRVGMVAGGGLLVLGPVCIWLLPRPRQLLAMLAWLLLLLPLPLMAFQQVQVPARALLYTSFLGCVLGSLVATFFLDRLRLPARWQLALGLLVVAAYGGYQFRRQLAPHQDEVREHNQMQAAYAWLTQQSNPRVLLAAPDYELYFRHYTQQEHRPMLLHTTPAPGQVYNFTVQRQGADSLPAWALPPFYFPVYRNNFVVIYARARN
ncbi:hypothetical protein J0X19_11420 [Hymenobacter sp. BT186]|uniref:Glycosyltransferase RgtA/B/C/D-like domain-containing protein n=1 Tax=Hymenobacter telluris TaxID=2816474 RepID=A0A939JAX1_9BACT|nr:hypothetical protein [Hymenobacter telluris]MBO0358556.1 hypothetical protein [Hymenobacter telluris]MBW3374582.1 hypothetical protein [Hymenobacter norwichensis]